MRLRVAPFALLKRLALRLLLIAAVLWGGGIALFSVLPVPFSAVMLERQVSAWLSGDFHYLAHSDWVAMDKISPWMGLAVIAAEDQKFPEHWGFDVSAIEKALAHNERHDTRIRGASTLSQQTAKNLFLWDGRSWLRKGLEAGLTVGIETVWSKKRILTVYLNIAEFGDGIFGVEAAAQRYFHKPASQLTPGKRLCWPRCCRTRSAIAPMRRQAMCAVVRPGSYARCDSWAGKGSCASISSISGLLRRRGWYNRQSSVAGKRHV